MAITEAKNKLFGTRLPATGCCTPLGFTYYFRGQDMYPDYPLWPVIHAENREELMEGLVSLATIPGLSEIFSAWYINRVQRINSHPRSPAKSCALVLGDEEIIPIDNKERLRSITREELYQLFDAARKPDLWSSRLHTGLHIAIQLVEFIRRKEEIMVPSLVPLPIQKPILLGKYRDKIDALTSSVNGFISRYSSRDVNRFIYVAGPPGTGKTTWAQWCIEQALLKTDWNTAQIKPVFGSICCAKESLTWESIWEGLCHTAGLETGQDLMNAILPKNPTSRTGPRKRMIVFLLLDEFDLLDSSNRKHAKILDHVLHLLSREMVGTRLFVLATGNKFVPPTDQWLGENQLGPKSIDMPSYDSADLEAILRSRHARLVSVYDPRALTYLTKWIANEGGDARKALTLLQSLVLERDPSVCGEVQLSIGDVQRVLKNKNYCPADHLECLPLYPRFLVIVVAWLTKRKKANNIHQTVLGVSCNEVKSFFVSAVSEYYCREDASMVDEYFHFGSDHGLIEYSSSSDGIPPDPLELITLVPQVSSLERRFSVSSVSFYDRLQSHTPKEEEIQGNT